ncbi:Arrestin domain-containing protein 4 [Sarcoptes scabiei]|uniref:Arrestin domain-containing protein 4 n=2 Tax=Sarcoptes scabiei TaxID=52283 RepID=A0A834RIP3_SARSC|nr:Arrestin domain-containing protein 4 [Sarcoptes scabiei]
MSFEAKDYVTAVFLVPDRPSASYAGGELVTGHCIITVEGNVSFDFVEVKFVGKARVSLPIKDGNNNGGGSGGGKESNCFTKDHNIIEMVYKPSTIYHAPMTTGKHDIGFSFVIPPNIPSSVDSPLGFIRYKIKAKAGSEKAELLLNIIASPIIPITELSVPIIQNKSKKVGFFNGKQVLLHCEIIRSGFTLGTKIPIRCTVNNQTKRTIVLKGALRQNITFKANEEERSTMNKLSSVYGTTISPESNITHDLSIQLPQNLPIVHNTCPIIKIQYSVVAKLKIPQAFDMRLNMPVILTSLPIDDNQMP